MDPQDKGEVTVCLPNSPSPLHPAPTVLFPKVTGLSQVSRLGASPRCDHASQRPAHHPSPFTLEARLSPGTSAWATATLAVPAGSQTPLCLSGPLTSWPQSDLKEQTSSTRRVLFCSIPPANTLVLQDKMNTHTHPTSGQALRSQQKQLAPSH